MPDYNEIIKFGKEVKRPPSVRDRVIDFISKHSNEYFSKEDIWMELKGKLCYYSAGPAIFEANEKTMDAIIQGFFVVGFLEKNIKQYKDKTYILYKLTDLGKAELWG